MLGRNGANFRIYTTKGPANVRWNSQPTKEKSEKHNQQNGKRTLSRHQHIHAPQRNALHPMKFPGRAKPGNNYNNYLEVSSLVKRIRRSEDSHFPLKHVVLVNEFHAEPLDGFLLEAFIFEGERPQCAAGRLCHISRVGDQNHGPLRKAERPRAS